MSTSDAAPAATPVTEGSREPSFRYTPALAQEIEQRWQDRWEERGTFHAANPAGDLRGPGGAAATGSPYFIMDMFPYPSGAGLHVGHPLGYIATDVVGRFRRMQGDNVLHALGYDAFGLPAEQYAVQTGQHPRTTTEANIATMKRQLRRMGLAHDPRRSFATIDPGYVRWTQWIFLQIFDSWYDDEAVGPGGAKGRARRIAELREELAAGTRPIPGYPEGTAWADLSEAEQRDVVDAQRLAYVDESPVNWAPGLGTVLANEEVTADGRSERGNFPVFTKALRQWKMRITAYADRLTDDLELIDWPEKVKSMQRNWIGRSTGANVRFHVVGTTEGDPAGAGGGIEVFTTRPDTLFGATFMVVSPEHPLLDEVPAAWPDGTKSSWTGGHKSPVEAVAAYRKAAAAKTAVERQADAGKKTGVFSGHLAVNPLTGTYIPVFTADYVLMGYGTGAIMAVPGGDERDFAFAQAFDLPVIYTVAPEGGLPEGFDEAWTGDGVAVNSPAADAEKAVDLDINGLPVAEAKAATIAWLEAHGIGEGTVTYRLRDWLFSRQRYWGEPFPIVWDAQDRPVAIPESLLPVDLPDVPDYAPRTFDPEDKDSSPEAPLGRNDDWVNITLDLGDGPQQYRRDTNTMPNWAGSCWYYLRYLDPGNAGEGDGTVVDRKLDEYWMGPHHNPTSGPAGGVDLYVGGVEHAVLHLLYARFWHKVLFDLGFVSSIEPFGKLFNQGYIQAYAYRDAQGFPVPAAEVEGDEQTGFTWNGEAVVREYGKMGKSLKNVVTPDEMYEAYGADTFRVYEMSMGPLDLSRPWNTRDVVGSQRFLQRLWRNVISEETGEVTVTDEAPSTETLRAVHRAIADVTAEMEGMRPNTAIAKLITLNNHLTSLPAVPRAAVEPLVLMVAPLAPHLAEELWERLGHNASLAHEPFPVADPQYLVEDTVTCVVQVQGKVRGRLEVPPSISDADLQAAALAEPNVVKAMDGKPVRKVVVRAPKLVNIVV
ncbi:leucyl-tRNA synthetase [Xylanimonas cellulosilytica DSM 15894]|uniref:Leucine--tRNA ligase n=1 Tax=Xylanimonas cellulosilytica (strain DSM 15894 / JCM 12276 / CECT 5975 / KCTC 9989 / LMG 20990 / NBRC 107835 / XIL07) TaxID=446471 RepID=D1BV02_XYLCX|nr:leucine--tRNA ligase [Xylanimonas cellulosilytica]ACZ31241.1 leucyl-tRNA synthetase [Xylanimonas cellulosilytica DSM 15894]